MIFKVKDAVTEDVVEFGLKVDEDDDLVLTANGVGVLWISAYDGTAEMFLLDKEERSRLSGLSLTEPNEWDEVSLQVNT